MQVVQCLTELGLSVKQARISSDGGWFVDGEQLGCCAAHPTIVSGADCGAAKCSNSSYTEVHACTLLLAMYQLHRSKGTCRVRPGWRCLK